MEKSSPADAAKLSEADREWMALGSVTSHPLFAQLARSDGPIGENEQLATILCENVETVHEIVELVRATQIQDAKAYYQQALDLIQRTKEAGFSIPAVEEKLALLKEI